MNNALAFPSLKEHIYLYALAFDHLGMINKHMVALFWTYLLPKYQVVIIKDKKRWDKL